jgi:opacity protein-like surface antigen
MKRILLLAASAVLVITVSSAAWYNSRLHNGRTTKPSDAVSTRINDKLSGYARQAGLYTASHQFNTDFCFLADMSIASGKPRFFVVDINTNKVLMQGLVTHGRCNENWLNGRKYGNTVGCGCTSLGRYQVANPYQGKFGLAYKLKGLDATNNNAYARFVVLHSMECVPEKEVDPYPICQSDGCPTVSPGFLQQLSALLNSSKKPVLLWIFE